MRKPHSKPTDTSRKERAPQQTKMIERQERSLLAEMERVKSLMKLTPEERKKEVRRQMYVELKAMEMERRQRVAMEAAEKCERDREEREKATESLRRQREDDQEERVRQEAERREEEERRASEQKALQTAKQQQLKDERLQWKKVMLVEEELVKRPVCLSALKKEQQRRREEAELCRPPRAGDKAGPDRLTSGLKAEQQGKKKTLYNNWVGEQKPDSGPVKGKLHPNSSTYLLFAAKPGPKSEGLDHIPLSYLYNPEPVEP